MSTQTGTADRNRGTAAEAPVPVVRAAVPVPGSPAAGTGPANGSPSGSAPTGTAPGTGTGTSSPVPGHSSTRFRLLPIIKKSDSGPEPTGTGTATSSGSPGSGSPAPAEDATGEAAKWTFLRSPDFWLWTIIIAVNVVAGLLAMEGTLRGWEWAGLDAGSPMRFALPFLAEFMVVAWLLSGEAATRKKQSPWLAWLIAAAFAVAAVALNVAFGQDDPKHRWRQAAIFGTASAGSLLLAFFKFYIHYISREVDEGMRDGKKPKIMLRAGAILTLRTSWRATLIANMIGTKEIVKEGKPTRVPLTLADYMALASTWRQVYEDYRAETPDGTRGDRQLAKRTAWNAVRVECGLPVYVPQRLTVGRTEFVRPQSAPEAIETPEEALVKFERELTDKPAAPKPPAVAKTPPPARPAPQPTAVEEVDPEWFVRYANHILLVQSAVPDWETTTLTVDDIQALGRRPEMAGKGLAKRENASRIAACIRSLQADAAKASK